MILVINGSASPTATCTGWWNRLPGIAAAGMKMVHLARLNIKPCIVA